MKTDARRETPRQRKKIIEHPFGATKAVWRFKQYLCRTKERVLGEQSLTFLARNLRRIINIFVETQENLAAGDTNIISKEARVYRTVRNQGLFRA
jgi:hypothetical protein